MNNYYNNKANEFFENTVNADMSPYYKEFLKLISKEGHILDAGAGSGRDSRYFISNGYKVTAFDGSSELAKMASNYIGQEVLNMNFNDIDFECQFDGLWACASLLHVPREEIHAVLNKLFKSLKSNAGIYFTFKYGEFTGFRGERFYEDYTENTFKELISEHPEIEVLRMWKTGDVRSDKKQEPWLNIIAKKK